MSQLAHYNHANRPPTPCTLQGRKRQYDLLQRSAAITGGYLPDVDLHRPDQDPDERIILKCDKLCHRISDLPNMPREAAFLTEPYVEDIRAFALRCEKALPQQLSKARLRSLLRDRKVVHQDELVDLLCSELDAPMAQGPLPPKEPLYASALGHGGAEVMSLEAKAQQPASALDNPGVNQKHREPPKETEEQRPGMQPGEWGIYAKPVCLQLKRADIKAYVSCQRTNRDDEVDVEKFLENVYMPEDQRKVIHVVNDGLNRHIRGHRPPRERPSNDELPRHVNYWEARYMMELLADNMATVENSNGGKLKPSKMFKRLDGDGDGYISLSDLKSACARYKVPHSSADLHAMFSQLDKADNGSIDIGEFTRQFELHQGNLIDAMSRPIKAVHHEGGVQYGGPVQDALDACERQVAAEHSAGGRATSAPPGSSGSGGLRVGTTGSASSSQRLPIITDMTALGHGRVSDVIRARCSQWKAHKSEFYTAPAKTRFGMTVHPDTRHVTESCMPLSSSFMSDADRFKTTNASACIFATPDHQMPQAADSLKHHARNEFKVERIRHRQREFTERCWAANAAAQDFDDQKIARKALTQINYERRCRMSCG